MLTFYISPIWEQKYRINRKTVAIDEMIDDIYTECQGIHSGHDHLQ